ncbi:MAG: M23 family metallopeptidase [Clostridia bacterium]|nr:M23 family metallopeptidase [Clostridia bacterium]
MNKEEQQTKRLPIFYIALCCCVIAIGVAGYLTEKNTNSQSGESLVYDSSAPLPQTDTIVQNPVSDTVPASSNETDIEETEEVTNNTSEETVEAAAIENVPAFTMPANGEILEEYSDKPVYNSVLCDWRTHNGIDIAVDNGGSVMAIADGTVTEVSEDEKGKYIVISHDNGFVSKYCALSDVNGLEVDAKVKAGDVIGIVGKSKGENTQATHLHFELYKDSECVNPTEYLG